MNSLVGFPFHSNDNEIITITLLMRKRFDPDFSVQSLYELCIYRFEAFDLSGFHATQAYDPSWYLFSAITGDGTQKAEWTMQPLLRIKSLGLLIQHVTPAFRNHAAENMLSEVELQHLASYLPALTLEIMLQKIYGLNASDYQVPIGLVTPEIMLQKTCFRELDRFLESEMESHGESEIDPRVGFIFSPTNEEIIIILKHKKSHPDFYVNAILECNVYEYEPYMLREAGDIHSDGKWYFLCARNPVSGGGYRRSTKTGYWKSTGEVRPIKAGDTQEVIGTKRTLVFHNRFPGGREEKTNWVMHEYSDNNNPQDLVLYRIQENKDNKEKEKKNKKRCISTKNEDKRAKKHHISANCVIQPELPRSDAVENTYPERRYYSVFNFNNHAIEATLQVDPLPPQNLIVLNGFTGLDQASFSVQSPILPEGASYSWSNEIEVLNSSFASESQGQDDLQGWVFDLDELLTDETVM